VILVTGANGFVGTALCRHLQAKGHPVRRALRSAPAAGTAPGDWVATGDLSAAQDWGAALTGCAAVAHLAARVHVMNDGAAEPLAEFRRVNVEGTLNLARQAARRGVRRFVFVSSVKVNGEATAPGKPFAEEQPAAPQDPYGISKHEAEQGLRALSEETGMQVVIVRPPLVYGPGVRANFRALARAVQARLPLPLALVHNRRSLVGLDNLTDFLGVCLEHPAAAGQTFLVSDGEDLSTPELVRRMAMALGRRAVLLPVPTALLVGGATLVGKRDVARRLCESLQVSIDKARGMLGWAPPASVDQQLRAALQDLRAGGAA
jgi:nucleoside-diphosphate-sugar epimerase